MGKATYFNYCNGGGASALFCAGARAGRKEMDMKKLFISQPMNGKTDQEILETREKAIASVKEMIGADEDVEVIDSFFQNAPVDASPLWYLGKSLELLSVADIAYFAKGWDKARGCKIEHICAIEYGIGAVIEES